ncbi:hypothetical protein SCHPADRAFT_339061 [Schizopora paradoxa]|uniref:Mid2 domain-containing protein n=1 Tax=Schizopora paradoxa TaxID=27342 RepID=A0A0H2SAT0_9AGAM|nr:hypothetical protein SCHPADRAFT_339061 [Schizopora paradoxa]
MCRSTRSTDFRWLVHFLVFLLSGPLSTQFVRAFNFEFSAPGQCDPLNISWTGGTSPFSLLIAPLFRNFLNISVPASAYDAESQTGSFSTQLSFPENQKFLLAMSDASGFGSGGISSVLTTGTSATGSACDTTLNAVPAFTFAIPDQLQQCSEFIFDGYSNSTQPNTIRGLIPLGQTVTLETDPSTNEFTWQANVPSGTSMVFIITDSLGRGGGTSDVEIVTESSNAACLNEQSPHSTASSATSMTATSTATSQSSPTTTPQSSKSNLNTGVVAGIAVGVVAILLFVILLVVVLVRRRRRPEQNAEYAASQVTQLQGMPISTRSTPSNNFITSAVPGSYPGSQAAAELVSNASPYSPYSTMRSVTSSSPYSSPSGNEYQQDQTSAGDPYSRIASMLPNPHPQSAPYSGNSNYPSQPEVFSSTTYLVNPPRQTLPETRPEERSLPSKSPFGPTTQVTSRLVLHTDVDDSTSDISEPVEEREVMELPPQYSDRRRSLPQQPQASGEKH